MKVESGNVDFEVFYSTEIGVSTMRTEELSKGEKEARENTVLAG